MKSLLILGSLMLASTAYAQSYVGIMAGDLDYHLSCDKGKDSSCKNSADAWRVFGGVIAAPEKAWSLGPVALDGLELGYTRISERKESIPGGASVYDPEWTDSNFQFLPADVERRVKVDALTVAGVAHLPVGPYVRLAARLGAAYVSAQITRSINGVSSDSNTRNSLQPYGGLGIEIDVGKYATLSAVYEQIRFKVGDDRGHVSWVGLGAQTKF